MEHVRKLRHTIFYRNYKANDSIKVYAQTSKWKILSCLSYFIPLPGKGPVSICPDFKLRGEYT